MPPPQLVDPLEARARLVSRQSSRASMWLPLPYHPELRVPIGEAVHAFNTNHHYAGLYGVAFSVPSPSVRIAWRNHNIAHEFLVRRALNNVVRASPL